MATMYYENDVNPKLIKAKKVAVIGYGSQGHAHALNMRDNGVNIMVGLRESSKSRAKAEADGLRIGTVATATEWADVIMVLAPDTMQPEIYREEIAPNLAPGDTLMFAHGFNIHYETIVPPGDVDVSLLAPKAPGHRVRQVFVHGGGTPSLVAVYQDASGQALDNALSYAWATGGTRAGVLLTTFKEETETDLFGEQAVLCGGVSELVKAGFETLVEGGYQPELAYFETMHELKLIVDLFYQGGLNYMRYSVSDTAEYGDYVSGPRVVGEQVKYEMKRVLADIQSGKFARQWIAENESGRVEFNRMRQADQDHMIERVGAKLRAMMPFVEPVEVKPGE
ncbi:MAG: ketol-acid reductoisomerase [Anaerolineae bacterium]|nr:ketol-acid reductoisomerase [Anaerolineae bacterium]